MKGLPQLFSLLGIAGAAAYGLAGCGGDEISCGTGTVREGDTCVPEATCGTGTTLEDGECVPDGSVICEQGTTFDMATGTCVVDPSACAAGTVLVGGECVPEDDTLTADLEEAAEPNETMGAGAFDVPALNEDITIHGCITPRAGQADEDVWIMTATGPTLLEITADGVGGLAAGFIVQDLGIPQLANYSRFGVNLVGDTSKRQVYLPVAGDYVLVMDDSRALLLGEAAGDANTCYYGTIKTVPMPAATPATLPQTTGEDSGNVRVISYTPGQIGDIFDATETTGSTGMLPAFIVRKNGQFYASAAYDQTNDVPPFYTVGGLAATDTIEIVVDSIYNFSLTPQAYAFDFFDIAAQALPTDGTPVTVTKKNGTIPEAPWWEWNHLYFDVATAGQLVHFQLTASEAVRMLIVRADIFTPAGAFATLANIATTGTGATTFNNQYVRFAQPGRYYFLAIDTDGTAADTYTITSTLVDANPTALTYGTAATAQALPAHGSGFHTLDLTAVPWLEVAITGAANWGGNARVTLYDLAGEGWLNNGYNAVQTGTQATDGTAPLGRITLGDARDFLVRVEATAAPGTDPTYDIHARERPHVMLPELMAGTPITRTGMDNLAGGAVNRYLVYGTAGQALDIVATPLAAADVRIDRRNVDETIPTLGTANAGGAGVAETLRTRFGANPNWVAFSISNTTAGTATDVDLSLTATPPIPYVDICGTGTVLPAPHNGAADDEYTAVQTLPGGFTFNFFGVAQTELILGANGFLVFGNTNPTCSFGCFSNGTIPSTTQPNGMIAPYWDDLQNIRICRKDEANKVTFQWSGVLYNTTTGVQFQVVLNDSGRIDFIYGPMHAANGSSATVGAENAAGTVGIQIGQNTAGMTPPSSSYSITTPTP